MPFILKIVLCLCVSYIYCGTYAKFVYLLDLSMHDSCSFVKYIVYPHCSLFIVKLKLVGILFEFFYKSSDVLHLL